MEANKKAAEFSQAASNAFPIPNNTSSPATLLLGRLEKVIDRGGGQYSALCPAHEDKSPSLSIKETDDRILLYCFAGCSAGDVTAAVGLSLADLYERPLDDRRLLLKRPRFDARALLLMLKHEATKVAIAAHDIAEGRTLTEDDRKALETASRRISRAMEAVT